MEKISKEKAHEIMRGALGGTVPFDVEEALNYILDSYEPDVSIGMDKSVAYGVVAKAFSDISIANPKTTIFRMLDELYESIEPKNVVAEFEGETQCDYLLQTFLKANKFLIDSKTYIVTIAEKKS